MNNPFSRFNLIEGKIFYDEDGEYVEWNMIEEYITDTLIINVIPTGFNVVDAFYDAGLSNSKSKVRRLIEQGGVYVNNRRVKNIDACLTEVDLINVSVIILRAGKKNYTVLRFDCKD